MYINIYIHRVYIVFINVYNIYIYTDIPPREEFRGSLKRIAFL